MLIVTRKDGEGLRFRLPDGIEFTIHVERKTSRTIRVKIDAPRAVEVHRAEWKSRAEKVDE